MKQREKQKKIIDETKNKIEENCRLNKVKQRRKLQMKQSEK